MRSILNISLPEAKKKDILKRAKKSGKSVSAYILTIFDLEQELISEDDLLVMAKKARAEHKAGKTKVLKSLKALG